MPHDRSLRAGPIVFSALLAVFLCAAAKAQDDCLSCHASEDEVGDAAYVVDSGDWEATVHGAAGISCADCHADADGDPHAGVEPRSKCVDCHEDQAAALKASVHGNNGGPMDAKHPDCASCHGPIHSMAPSDHPASWIFPSRLAETCGNCHADPELAAAAGIKLVQPIAAYAASVHARALERGEKAATCSSCHGSHDILPGADPRSHVNRENVPETCAQCHAEISATFEQSVHGEAAAAGIRESPVCTDCHGEHRILGPADQGSPVYATNVPKMTCGRCHGDLRVTEKFGLKSTAVEAFEDSFHGLAGRTGNATVANCASCHGVHDILPSSDPRSHVSPQRLAETCGACHPGAGKTFAIGPVHVLPKERDAVHPAVFWIRVAYLWLIWLTIGGMFLHNFLDLRRKTLSPIPRPVLPRLERRRRMSLGFRIAHIMLLASFLTLVWSGFALKYPDGIWAQPLLAWEARFGFRGWLHRGAALVMLAAFGYHIVHLVLSRRARACIAAMRPTLHDWHELKEKFRWFLGKRPDMPLAPALGYAEKAEYLALVWGTLVMAASGFILWFSDWSLEYLPKWGTDVATVIHFYEAVLASLAILVWHFYFVMFDPLVYPMDTTWLHGYEAPGRGIERTEACIEPKPKKAKPAGGSEKA